MASQDGADSLRTRRRELAKRRGEPLETVQRPLMDPNGSLYVNMPSLARKVLDLEKGQQMTVEQWDDRVVIYPEGKDDA
jgi:hypothetical protein